MVVFQMSVHLASVLCHVSKISKKSTPNFCTPSRLNIFHSQLPTSHFSRECVQVPSFSEDSWRQALSASPRGQHRLRLLPLSASLPLPRGRGAQSSVWLSRAPRRGMASCKGRRVITARRPTEGAAHVLRDCLSSWASLWSRGFRPEPSLAGEPGPVPRKEIRRSLVILEQGSDQSKSPVELNGRLRQAPAVKRMGGLVAGRFVVTACGEAVR